jgi:hypothetical protein
LQAGTDGGLLECETCPTRLKLQALDEKNADAWQRYHRVVGHRLVWDAQAGNWWFAQVFADVEPDDLDELMQRLRILYDVFQPPQTRD